MRVKPDPAAPIAWDIRIPLVTNPVMLRAMAVASFGAGLLVAGLVGLLLAVQGEWGLALRMAGLLAAAGAGLFAVALVVMLLVFGNRLQLRFTVSADGVRCETVDRVARAGNRLALIAGLLTGRGGVAGSGMLAMAQEDQTLPWQPGLRMDVDARRCVIGLRNGWRTLLWVYCTPANFAEVRARIDAALARAASAGAMPLRSPLPGLLWRTGLTVLAALPLLLAARVLDYGLLPPFLLLCFALASVWLVRGLAWVTLAAAAWIAVASLGAALAPRAAVFTSSSHTMRFQWFTGDDWALTLLAASGLAYLVATAVLTLRRRLVPALEGDEAGPGGR